MNARHISCIAEEKEALNFGLYKIISIFENEYF